ncbi:MAG: glycosyltransferase family 1 protein [Verrucomicrobia bacterium]|nr:glycosyltransferase family 1 protein [Verrucomicrobiota bacterium]
MGLLQTLAKTLRGPAPAPAPYTGPARVLLACPDHAAPAGGVRQIYRLAATLRADLGLDAYVYHRRTGFTLDWFQTTAQVAYADATAPGPRDLLVLPEVWGNAMQEHPGVRKIIFNQNAYYTFMNGYETVPSSAPLSPADHGVIGLLTVSDDSAELLTETFPRLPVARVRYEVDAELFAYTAEKRPQVAFMPRKHPDEARQLLNTLALRGALAGFEVVAIDGVSEREAARLLRESLVFLSFGYPEGFSLPPAEAMATGCLTLGYHGMGAREFLLPEYSWPIEVGHTLDYVRAVESVLTQWRRDPAPLRARAAAASRFIHGRYSRSAYVASVRDAWSRLLS